MSGEFIGSIHSCAKPEAREADVGRVWACHCGRRWAVTKSLYFELRKDLKPQKDAWPFETQQQFQRRLDKWQATTDSLSAVNWYELQEGTYVDG